MSEQYTASGKILHIFPTASYGQKGFTKREFVIETEEKFPQQLKFEVTKDRCDALDKYREGQEVKVHFNLRGREHNGKFYNSHEAWRLEAEGGQPQQLGIDPPPWKDSLKQRATPMDQQPAEGEPPF